MKALSYGSTIEFLGYRTGRFCLEIIGYGQSRADYERFLHDKPDVRGALIRVIAHCINEHGRFPRKITQSIKKNYPHIVRVAPGRYTLYHQVEVGICRTETKLSSFSSAESAATALIDVQADPRYLGETQEPDRRW